MEFLNDTTLQRVSKIISDRLSRLGQVIEKRLEYCRTRNQVVIMIVTREFESTGF